MKHTLPDAQHDPHNKPPANVRRIRMSWIVIVLLFTALALTAVLLMLRGGASMSR